MGSHLTDEETEPQKFTDPPSGQGADESSIKPAGLPANSDGEDGGQGGDSQEVGLCRGGTSWCEAGRRERSSAPRVPRGAPRLHPQPRVRRGALG